MITHFARDAVRDGVVIAAGQRIGREGKFNLIRDEQNLGRWVESIIEETATWCLSDACNRLADLFEEWALDQRRS